MADPYPDTPEERQRTKLIRSVAITAAVTAVLVAVGIVWLAGSGSGKKRATAAATPKASVVYDNATLTACEKAKVFSVENGTQKDAESARSSAALSDQQVLREIAKRNETPTNVWSKALDEAHAVSAAFEVSTWCINHRVPGSY